MRGYLGIWEILRNEEHFFYTERIYPIFIKVLLIKYYIEWNICNVNKMNFALKIVLDNSNLVTF